jgi:hypothetical protein
LSRTGADGDDAESTMSSQLPPPPPGTTTSAGAIPPPPEVPARPGRARLYAALVLALAAIGGIVAILVVSLRPATSGSVLFRDDFSERTSRWLEADDDTGSMGYVDGRYRVAVHERGELQSIARLPAKETSLTIEVDGTMVDGTGGFSILCVSEVSGAPGAITQLQDRGTYYDFFLSFADDAYAILSSTDLRAPLAVAEDADGLLRDGANHVEVSCSGAAGDRAADLSLRVNGRRVLSYSDPDGARSYSAVGLTVYSEGGPAEVTFDDLTVFRG